MRKMISEFITKKPGIEISKCKIFVNFSGRNRRLSERNRRGCAIFCKRPSANGRLVLMWEAIKRNPFMAKDTSVGENWFSTIGKYKPLENATPEKNYSTEIFVCLLNYSIRRGAKLFSYFMNKLGEQINWDDYSNITIVTQKPFFIVILSILAYMRNKLNRVKSAVANTNRHHLVCPCIVLKSKGSTASMVHAWIEQSRHQRRGRIHAEWAGSRLNVREKRSPPLPWLSNFNY